MRKVELRMNEEYKYKIINTYDGGIRVLFINKTSLSRVFFSKKCCKK